MTAVDDRVVVAARAGDQAALATVYSELSPQVLGYLRARGAEDPEGLTNEVFVHVIRRLADLTGGAGGLRTFVFSVAHARLVDDLRRRSRRPAQAPYHPELDDRTEPSAETEALHSDRAAHLRDALSMLGDEQRTVIALRVLGDLSVEQTAAVIGKSTGAVKQLQRRALLALRSHVERGEVAL